MIQAVVGVLSGVVASMGLGGGFVLLIWLTMFQGMPQLLPRLFRATKHC